MLHSTTVLVSISQKTQRTTKESHAALCETAVSRSLRNVRGPNAQIGTSWGPHSSDGGSPPITRRRPRTLSNSRDHDAPPNSRQKAVQYCRTRTPVTHLPQPPAPDAKIYPGTPLTREPRTQKTLGTERTPRQVCDSPVHNSPHAQEGYTRRRL